MTYSIVAIDRKAHALGVATATGNKNVVERVPCIKRGVAAIATQGFTVTSFGIRGLDLVEKGYIPHEALKQLLSNDPYKEYRQVIIIDAQGQGAAFTGQKTLDHKGQIIGKDYVIAGNLLAKDKVITEMEIAFGKKGRFAEKLFFVLQAGQKAGGDLRGERSAALIVEFKSNENLILKVDNHHNPIKELERLLNANRRSF